MSEREGAVSEPEKRYIPFSKRPGPALDGLLEDLLKAWANAQAQPEPPQAEEAEEGEEDPPAAAPG